MISPRLPPVSPSIPLIVDLVDAAVVSVQASDASITAFWWGIWMRPRSKSSPSVVAVAGASGGVPPVALRLGHGPSPPASVAFAVGVVAELLRPPGALLFECSPLIT